MKRRRMLPVARRALRCRLREVIWAGGWVAEAEGVDGWLWIADGRTRLEAARRRVEKWARANGFAIAWQLSVPYRPESPGPADTAPRRGRATGLRCRLRNSWGWWVAEALGVDEWLCVADARMRPETLRRRVEEWARANGIAVAWDGTPGVAAAPKRHRPTRR